MLGKTPAKEEEPPEDDSLEGLTGLELSVKRYDLNRTRDGHKKWKAVDKSPNFTSPDKSKNNDTSDFDRFGSALDNGMPHLSASNVDRRQGNNNGYGNSLENQYKSRTPNKQTMKP